MIRHHLNNNNPKKPLILFELEGWASTLIVNVQYSQIKTRFVNKSL